jgi:hypothetical protein
MPQILQSIHEDKAWRRGLRRPSQHPAFSSSPITLLQTLGAGFCDALVAYRKYQRLTSQRISHDQALKQAFGLPARAHSAETPGQQNQRGGRAAEPLPGNIARPTIGG